MKKLIYLFLLTLLTACPSGGDKFNPGEKPPVNIPQPDTLEIPEKPIDTIIEKPGRDTIPESKPEKPKPKPIQSPVPELAEAGETSLKISWVSVGADAHKVYIRTKPGSWDNIYTIGNETNITINKLIPDTDYDILVQALKDNKKKNSKVFVFRTQDRAEEPENPAKPEHPKKIIGKTYALNVDNLSKDNTQEVQQFIDSVESGYIADNGDTIVNVIEFPEAKIWTEGIDISVRNKGIIDIVDKHFLIIKNGNFHTKRPGIEHIGSVGGFDYSHRRHMWIEESSNIEFQNTIIEGSNQLEGGLIGISNEHTPDWWVYGEDKGSRTGYPVYKSYLEFEHAFAIENSTYITLTDIKVNGVFGDGICIGGGTALGSHHIKVIRGELKNIGRQGIAVYNSTNVLIDGTKGERLRRAFIDLEPYFASGFANNITIRNTVSSAMQVTIAAMGRGQVNDIIVENNIHSGTAFVICRDSGQKERRKNWIVQNNERLNQFGSPSAPIKFYMTDNVIVRNNIERVATSQSRLGAYFSDCKNSFFIDNEVVNGKYVMLQNGSEVTIENNTPELEVKD